MLKLLALRENGTDHPRYLEHAESTRRSISLELSKHFDVQKCHKAGINCLDIDDTEGRYLLSSGADGLIGIHDLDQLSAEPKYSHPLVCRIDKNVRGCHKFSAETVQWYPLDTGMFTSSGHDKLLKIWDTNSLTVADEYEFSGRIHNHGMSTLASSHKLIAVADHSSKVRLIDIKSGAATHTLRGHKKPVLCVKWAALEEFYLATGSEDNRVMIWDIRRAKSCVMIYDQHNGDMSAESSSVNTAHTGMVNGLCYTQDGLNLLSFGSDNRLRLWSATTGANTNVNFGKISNESKKCVHIAVSDNNTNPTLVYVPNGSDIVIFNTATGEKVETLRGHYSQVNCCVSDSRTHNLYSGGIDRNILIWKPDVTTAEAYDEYLNANTASDPSTASVFHRRIGAMADTWSSDED